MKSDFKHVSRWALKVLIAGLVLTSARLHAWADSSSAPALTCVDVLSTAVQRDHSLFVDGIRVRSESEISELRFLAYNVENFFETTGKYEWESLGVLKKVEGREPVRKESEKLRGIREIFERTKPDIAVLSEVEENALDSFAIDSLGGEYRAFMTKGNDPRKIEVGVLIKKDLPWNIRVKSHRHMKWMDPETGKTLPLFTRDLPIVEFRRNPADVQPLFVIVGHHGKSMRGPIDDPGSVRWRTAQFEGIRRLLAPILKAKIPVVFLADLNSDVRFDPVVAILKSALISSLAAAPDAVPMKDRVTHTYHPSDDLTVNGQLDDILISPDLRRSLLSSTVIRYLDESGNIVPLATSHDERSFQPSDHLPVFARLTTRHLFSR